MGIQKLKLLPMNLVFLKKQFNRRFKQYSGFNPKTYSRVIRFETIIRQHPTISSLTEIAYENGYFDQAHLIMNLNLLQDLVQKIFGN